MNKDIRLLLFTDPMAENGGVVWPANEANTVSPRRQAAVASWPAWHFRMACGRAAAGPIVGALLTELGADLKARQEFDKASEKAWWQAGLASADWLWEQEPVLLGALLAETGLVQEVLEGLLLAAAVGAGLNGMTAERAAERAVTVWLDTRPEVCIEANGLVLSGRAWTAPATSRVDDAAAGADVVGDFTQWLDAAQAWVAGVWPSEDGSNGRWSLPDGLHRGVVLNLDGVRVMGHFALWRNGHHETMLLDAMSSPVAGRSLHLHTGRAQTEAELWVAIKSAVQTFLTAENEDVQAFADEPE